MTLIFFPVGIASAVPRLELFMELVGAICLSTLGLFLPAAVEIAWRWDRSLGKWNWILWKNLLIMLFSVIALISGCVYSVMGIIQNL